MDQGVAVHQLTLLLTSRRREPEAQAPASTEAAEPDKTEGATAEKEEPPRRCLNESAHKLYR
ncbi:MAG: hypothetical protein QOF83_1832 [Solirubrobacteraceae bacterium]|jgi:hypothetical protein|nr:hypothetical protein [Solirubrobacteraceae bacterium]